MNYGKYEFKVNRLRTLSRRFVVVVSVFKCTFSYFLLAHSGSLNMTGFHRLSKLKLCPKINHLSCRQPAHLPVTRITYAGLTEHLPGSFSLTSRSAPSQIWDMLRENVYAHFPGITLLYCLKIASTSVSTAIGEAGVFTEYFCCYNFFFRKDWRGKSCWLLPRESAPEKVKRLPLQLVLYWCGTTRIIWDCCWSWCISSPGAAAPRPFSDDKRARKWMNEWLLV